MRLVLGKTVQLLSVQILSVEQEAEIHRFSAVFFLSRSAGSGSHEVEIIVRRKRAVCLHHEGIDLTQCRIGVAAEIVALTLGIDDSVENLRQEEEAADDGRALLELGCHEIADIEADRKDQAGSGATAE